MEATPTGDREPHGLEDPGKVARARAGIPVVPAFDAYRALAILGVVMLHVLGLSGVNSGDGFISDLIAGTFGHAIDILFIVSGFVVFLPTVARGGKFGSVGHYALRRAARLYPAFWLSLAVCLVVIALVGSLSAPSVRDVIIHLFGLQTPVGLFVSGIPMGFGVNLPVWTLSVEICFYIVMPLIASAYFRHPFIGLGVAAAITWGWITGFQNIVDVTAFLGLDVEPVEMLRLVVSADSQLPAWAFSFALGMTGAWLYVKADRTKLSAGTLRLIRWAVPLAVLGLALFVWRSATESQDGPLILAVQAARHSPDIALGYSACLATLMVGLSFQTGPAGRLLSRPWLRKLGDISYGIFLSHMIFAFVVSEEFDLPTDGSVGALLLWTAVILAPSVLYGYLSARFLEQPIRRWARRYGRRESA